MNRRDFLKSAIILPGVASLLPTLAKETEPASTETTVSFKKLVGYVQIVGWRCNYSGSHSGPIVDTEITYRGTTARINDLRMLLERQFVGVLTYLKYEPDIEERLNDWGEAVGWIMYDRATLISGLRGRWHVKLGSVGELDANQTGVMRA